jgi:iron complex transport system permease protein
MSRLWRRKILTTCLALGAMWIVSILLSLNVGSVSIRPGKALRLIENLILGRASEDAAAEAILFSIRLPRVLLGSLVGSALALAGASFQSLLRNPLADPFVLGVSTGASFGTIVFSIAASALGFAGFGGALSTARPVAAFACAVGTVALVYLLSGGGDRAGEASQRLLLAGVVLASFISSINVFLLTITNQADLRGIFYWLIGDLSRPVDSAIYPVSFIVCAGFILLYLFSYRLNLISMGEEDAALLGVDVRRVKLGVYIVASLITGAVVSVSGPIAYIGLICPHMGRLMVGSDNRILFPVVVLFGAIFTLLADTLARTVLSPAELPVGVVTAFCGAPLFIYLLRRKGGGA